MKAASLLSLLSLQISQAQEDLPGNCPQVKKGWDQAKKGRLDLKRLSGTWINVYDHTQDQETECVSMKLVPMENSTQLNLLQGSVYTFPEMEEGYKKRIIYDDEVILHFNHKDDSSLSAMTVKGEDESEAKAKYLSNFDMPELSVLDKEDMSDDQIKAYEEEREEMA